jgi:hypothetical protein
MSSPLLLQNVASVSLLTSSSRFYGGPISGDKISLEWQPNFHKDALNTSVCFLSVSLSSLSLSLCIFEGCWQLLGWSVTSLHSETGRFIPVFRNLLAAQYLEFLNEVRTFKAR